MQSVSASCLPSDPTMSCLPSDLTMSCLPSDPTCFAADQHMPLLPSESALLCVTPSNSDIKTTSALHASAPTTSDSESTKQFAPLTLSSSDPTTSDSKSTQLAPLLSAVPTKYVILALVWLIICGRRRLIDLRLLVDRGRRIKGCNSRGSAECSVETGRDSQISASAVKGKSTSKMVFASSLCVAC